jgi:hypothetical protein
MKYFIPSITILTLLFISSCNTKTGNPDDLSQKAERREIPAPIMDIEKDVWLDRPENERKLVLWEWFDIYGIMNDFFHTMKNSVLVDAP